MYTDCILNSRRWKYSPVEKDQYFVFVLNKPRVPFTLWVRLNEQTKLIPARWQAPLRCKSCARDQPLYAEASIKSTNRVWSFTFSFFWNGCQVAWDCKSDITIMLSTAEWTQMDDQFYFSRSLQSVHLSLTGSAYDEASLSHDFDSFSCD